MFTLCSDEKMFLDFNRKESISEKYGESKMKEIKERKP